MVQVNNRLMSVRFSVKPFIVLILLSMTLVFSASGQKSQEAKNLTVKSIELGYPSPGIPFYHFKADLDLPQSSIIEVEAFVDGKALRANDLYRGEDLDNPNRPALTHRPPSGYGLSQDGTMYKDPHVIGWVKWQPGQNYKIRITVRMKKSVKASIDDLILTADL